MTIYILSSSIVDDVLTVHFQTNGKTMNEILDKNEVEKFVGRCHKLIDNIMQDLISMKQYGKASPSMIDRMLETVDAVQKGAKSLNLKTLELIGSLIEKIFLQFSLKKLSPTPEIIDTILDSISKILFIIGNIPSNCDIPCQEELEKLEAILDKTENDPESADDDIINEFVTESREHIETIEPALLLMEQGGEEVSKNAINSIFRAMHSIKGASSFFGFDSLTELSHIMENVFMKFRNNELTPNSETIDSLLAGVDKVRVMVEDIHDSSNVSYTDEMNRLKAILDGTSISNTASNINSLTKQADKAKPQKTVEPKIPENPKPASPETIRMNVDLIDKMMNLAGELVLGRNQLRSEFGDISSKNSKLSTIIQNVDIVTSELQENIMQMRIKPIGNLLNKFTRIVRDLSRHLSKKVDFIIEGKDVELDKTIIEGLSDPLTHLVRNAMDHGIETPKEREKIGKSPSGTLLIKTFHEGGQVNIVIIDDGKGIDPDKLADKAIANNVISKEQALNMNAAEKINLILLPGMSTAEEVTDISGRGVGMDVVKTNIEQLGGNLELETNFGKGTSVRIRLPLTLAIIPSLIVGASGQRYAIPQINVQELILVRAADISKRIDKIGESDVLRLRERLLPLVNLSEVLGMNQTYITPITENIALDKRTTLCDRRHSPKIDDDEIQSEIIEKRKNSADRRQSWRSDINIVVLKIGNNSFGLSVSELFDNEEIVVKPLSEHIKDCKCFAGATIMGDGRVAMILDGTGIAECSNLRFTDINAEEARRQKENRISKTDIDHQESMLFFNNAFNECFAMPLNSISRLERIEPDAIHRVGDQNYLEYLGEGLPLVNLENLLPVSPLPDNVDELYVIIPKTTDNTTGILASSILDTIDTEINVKKTSTTPRGLLGSAFINGQLTQFINTNELMEIIKEHLEQV